MVNAMRIRALVAALVCAHGYTYRAPLAMRSGRTSGRFGANQANRFQKLASTVRRMAVTSPVEVGAPPSVDVGGAGTKTREKKKRLVVRFHDKWVDLTGWRNAHPAGTHWIDLYENADATEVMEAFHSEKALKMLDRLPPAREEDVPKDVPPPSKVTYAFRELRKKLEAEGWYKRTFLGEAAHLAGWTATMATAIFAAKTGHPVWAAIWLAISNTGAGWLAHDYTHGRGPWCSFMRGFGELGGGMSTTWWSDKHNLHHALTNVVGIDEDLMVDPALYLWAPPPEKDTWVRKIQHIYWALPYSLLFAIWRIDSLKVTLKRKLHGQTFRLAAHYAIWCAIFPVHVLLPALFMSGLLTATIVTVSHVSEDLFFEGPHKVDFCETQLRTTRDFKTSNPFFEYLAGGMNYQVEHHLFPIMPRYRYPACQKVLRQFAKEHGVEHRLDTDWNILKRTINRLKIVGSMPADHKAPPSRSDEYPTLPAV